jgi:hypothetical protein
MPALAELGGGEYPDKFNGKRSKGQWYISFNMGWIIPVIVISFWRK